MFSAPVASYFQGMKNRRIRIIHVIGCCIIFASFGCQSPYLKGVQKQPGSSAQVMQLDDGIPDELMRQFRVMISIRGETVRDAVVRMMERDLDEFEVCQANKERALSAAGLAFEPQSTKKSSRRTSETAVKFYPHIYQKANFNYFYTFPTTKMPFEFIECENKSAPVIVIYPCSDADVGAILVLPIENKTFDYGDLSDSDIREIAKCAFRVEDNNYQAEAQIINMFFPAPKVPADP